MGKRSQELFAQANEIMPGGVNSPVRAFKNVGSDPIFIERGQSAYLFDVDGSKYIDFVLSWGPLVLGHADIDVVSALHKQALKGTSFGACCELEYQLAQIVRHWYPSLELLRFVNSGTEAGMAVVRLARAFTKRSKIIKFAGCYHGHLDALLVQAGSGAATFAVPSSAGVAENVARDTLVAEYNSLEQVQQYFDQHPDQIAAILVEPAAGNMGFVRPVPGFLEGLRELCTKHAALLVFDEVMTGFRVALGGMQALTQITPDLTMLGKVIGGGLPVGAFGGRAEIMKLLAPLGPVYQAGTLSGNPLAMSAGITTLTKWETVFETAASAAQQIVHTMSTLSKEYSIPLQADCLGTMFGFFFNSSPVLNYKDAAKSDLVRFAKFFNLAINNGLYFAPSQFEASFVSSCHDKQVMFDTQEALRTVFAQL